MPTPEPYLEASHGKAWKRSPRSALVSDWIVEAKWAHPFWSLYQLSAAHFREIPGVPPAELAFPEATHQVYLFAVSPDWVLDPDKAVDVLTPANFVAQIQAESDADVDARLERVVQSIIEGRLNPDTDFRQQWVQIFGDNMLRK